MSRRTGPLAPPEEPGRAAARRCTAAYCFAAALVAGTSTIALLPSAGAATEVTSARVWPAQEYTRITLEANVPIKHTLFSVKDPERLVLDLEEVEFNGQLQSLIAKVGAGDPYIKSVRIGRFRPGVVRVVLDLKEEAKPQVFMLKPVGDYGHRLVLDVYPLQPFDALAAMLRTDAVKPSPPVEPAVPTPRESAPVAASASPPSATPAPDPTERGARPPSLKTPARPDVARLVTIAIDAGHGGEDPGARGRGGTSEKDVTLAIARRLKTMIDGETNMRAVLVRDGDYFIPLHMRVQKARRINADLFVSVHADAYIKPNARGSSVFALSERGATSAAARWLAKKENEADLIGGVNLDVADPYLKQTLLDLSQTATISDSLKLAKAVLSELGEINSLHKSSVEQAGFAVLKSPDVPSILVETAFISNPEEERRLRDDAYQNKMAEAILAGIKRYFSRNPPLARSTLARIP